MKGEKEEKTLAEKGVASLIQRKGGGQRLIRGRRPKNLGDGEGKTFFGRQREVGVERAVLGKTQLHMNSVWGQRKKSPYRKKQHDDMRNEVDKKDYSLQKHLN